MNSGVVDANTRENRVASVSATFSPIHKGVAPSSALKRLGSGVQLLAAAFSPTAAGNPQEPMSSSAPSHYTNAPQRTAADVLPIQGPSAHEARHPGAVPGAPQHPGHQQQQRQRQQHTQQQQQPSVLRFPQQQAMQQPQSNQPSRQHSYMQASAAGHMQWVDPNTGMAAVPVTKGGTWQQGYHHPAAMQQPQHAYAPEVARPSAGQPAMFSTVPYPPHQRQQHQQPHQQQERVHAGMAAAAGHVSGQPQMYQHAMQPMSYPIGVFAGPVDPQGMPQRYGAVHPGMPYDAHSGAVVTLASADGKGGQMLLTAASAKILMESVDMKLEGLELRSQREKAAFLSSLGLRISQQHYSTTLRQCKEGRWIGAEKASEALIRMQQVLNAACTPASHQQMLVKAKEIQSQLQEQKECRKRKSEEDEHRSGADEESQMAKQAKRIPEAARQAMHAYFRDIGRRPTKNAKLKFLEFDGITMKQINVFFQNLRARTKAYPTHGMA